MKNNFLIYMHTAPNGKSYIGQTNNLPRRNRGHLNKTGCRAFRSAIDKYGWDNFEHRILAKNITLDTANVLEAKFIAEYNTLSPNGYNLRTGGDNSLHSEETKERQRKVKLGKKATPETLAKMSAASKNQSAETREKQRMAHVGRKRSEETKAKQSEAAKLRWAIASDSGKNKWSDEARKNHMEARGKGVSDETKKKISINSKMAWEKRRAEGKLDISDDEKKARRDKKNAYRAEWARLDRKKKKEAATRPL